MRSVQQLRENDQMRFNQADESPETPIRDYDRGVGAPSLLWSHWALETPAPSLPRSHWVLETPTSISSHAFWLRSHAFQIGVQGRGKVRQAGDMAPAPLGPCGRDHKQASG